MAPIRRYLRITKFSVLEVRIYLHQPSDVSWLLSSRDNVLDRIIQEVRPKVLPKLREENANAQLKGKGKKKKRGIKDVASQEDFEVSIFLKETSSRHSLLTKRKEFSNSTARLKSNGKGLTGWLGGGKAREDAIAIDVDEGNQVPAILREEEQDEVVDLSGIPEAGAGGKKRKSAEAAEHGQDEDDALFVSSSDEEFFATQRAKPSKKRQRRNEVVDAERDADEQEEPLEDDKKKLALDTTYDGFSIYGRILCLIVTRKGKKEPQVRALDDAAPAGGSQMMERFIATQVAREEGLSDGDDG